MLTLAARLSDSALAGKAATGGLAAFEELLERYEGPIFRACLRILGNTEDARDAAQEVFMKLHRNLRSFSAEREFSPWLYQIAVNECRDRLRKRREFVPLDDLPLADHSAGPERDASDSERRRILKDGLTRLPEAERAAIVLREIEGLSTAEAAAILGNTEQTVRSQISKGTARLKAFVEHALRRTT